MNLIDAISKSHTARATINVDGNPIIIRLCPDGHSSNVWWMKEVCLVNIPYEKWVGDEWTPCDAGGNECISHKETPNITQDTTNQYNYLELRVNTLQDQNSKLVKKFVMLRTEMEEKADEIDKALHAIKQYIGETSFEKIANEV